MCNFDIIEPEMSGCSNYDIIEPEMSDCSNCEIIEPGISDKSFEVNSSKLKSINSGYIMLYHVVRVCYLVC